MNLLSLGMLFFLATVNTTLAFDPATTYPKDVLSCQFTEPFFSITYDSATGEVVYTGVENYDEATSQFVPVILATSGSLMPVLPAGETVDSFYSIQGSQFELLANDGSLIMKLTLDMNGTDGMSDTIYPFSAEYNGFFGGCDTQLYPAVNTVDIYEGLKK